MIYHLRQFRTFLALLFGATIHGCNWPLAGGCHARRGGNGPRTIRTRSDQRADAGVRDLRTFTVDRLADPGLSTRNPLESSTGVSTDDDASSSSPGVVVSDGPRHPRKNVGLGTGACSACSVWSRYRIEGRPHRREVRNARFGNLALRRTGARRKTREIGLRRGPARRHRRTPHRATGTHGIAGAARAVRGRPGGPAILRSPRS